MHCQSTTGREASNAGVKRWLETTDRQSQHVSVITLAEIQKGIELLAAGFIFEAVSSIMDKFLPGKPLIP
jgi:hypothetical protein